MTIPAITSQKMPPIVIPLWDNGLRTTVTNSNPSQNCNSFDPMLGTSTVHLLTDSFELSNFSIDDIKNSAGVRLTTGITNNTTPAATWLENGTCYIFRVAIAPNGTYTLYALEFSSTLSSLPIYARKILTSFGVTNDAGNSYFAAKYISPYTGITYLGCICAPLSLAPYGFFMGYELGHYENTVSFIVGWKGQGVTGYTPFASNFNMLLGTGTQSGKGIMTLTALDEKFQQNLVNVLFDDPTYGAPSGVGTYTMRCNFGFQIGQTISIPTAKLRILSPDGSTYTPIEFAPQNAGAANMLAQTSLFCQWGPDNTVYVGGPTSTGVNSVIATNQPSLSAAPQFLNAPTVGLNPQRAIVSMNLPCYPACSNPPLLIN